MAAFDFIRQGDHKNVNRKVVDSHLRRDLAFHAPKRNIEDVTEQRLGLERQTRAVLLALSLSHPPLSRIQSHFFILLFLYMQDI
jgi:hypothetical protein